MLLQNNCKFVWSGFIYTFVILKSSRMPNSGLVLKLSVQSYVKALSPFLKKCGICSHIGVDFGARRTSKYQVKEIGIGTIVSMNFRDFEITKIS